MHEAEPPTSFITLKQMVSGFLIGSGLYSLYYVRIERRGGIKMMTYCMAGLSIGYGVSQFVNQYLKNQAEAQEQDEKNKL